MKKNKVEINASPVSLIVLMIGSLYPLISLFIPFMKYNTKTSQSISMGIIGEVAFSDLRDNGFGLAGGIFYLCLIILGTLAFVYALVFFLGKVHYYEPAYELAKINHKRIILILEGVELVLALMAFLFYGLYCLSYNAGNTKGMHLYNVGIYLLFIIPFVMLLSDAVLRFHKQEVIR